MQKAVILLVEGKSTGNGSLTPALKKSGYDFEVVHTGAAAFSWIESSNDKPDLIVFDALSMRSNGVRICRRIRRLLGDMPIIHCRSAGDSTEPDAEADIYLIHPFTPRKLLNRIRALLPADASTEEIVRMGEITIFRSKRSVDVAGRGEQRLTPKLLQLLEEFLRHPEELISRRQLMQNVWDTDYVGDTRTLDVHIRWVRECIEDNPAKPCLLKTIRGKGYILNLAQLKKKKG